MTTLIRDLGKSATLPSVGFNQKATLLAGIPSLSGGLQPKGAAQRELQRTSAQTSIATLSMKQAFDRNQIPSGTATASLPVLAHAAGLNGPKDNSLWDKYITGNDRAHIVGFLHVAALSINKSDNPKLNNPGFHYDPQSKSVMFADSKDGAGAFVQFMNEFTRLATNERGEYSDAAKKFINEGLPLLTAQFGPKLKAGLAEIAKENEATMNSGPMRFLQFMGGVETLLNLAQPAAMAKRPAAPKNKGREATRANPPAVSATSTANKVATPAPAPQLQQQVSQKVFGTSQSNGISAKTRDGAAEALSQHIRKTVPGRNDAAKFASFQAKPELNRAFDIANAIINARMKTNGVKPVQVPAIRTAAIDMIAKAPAGGKLDVARSLLEFNTWEGISQTAKNNIVPITRKGSGSDDSTLAPVAAGGGGRPNKPATATATATATAEQTEAAPQSKTAPQPAPTRVLDPQQKPDAKPTVKPGEIKNAPQPNKATAAGGGGGDRRLPGQVNDALNARYPRGWSADETARGDFNVADGRGRRVGKLFSLPGQGGKDWFFRPTGRNSEKVGTSSNQAAATGGTVAPPPPRNPNIPTDETRFDASVTPSTRFRVDSEKITLRSQIAERVTSGTEPNSGPHAGEQYVQIKVGEARLPNGKSRDVVVRIHVAGTKRDPIKFTSGDRWNTNKKFLESAKNQAENVWNNLITSTGENSAASYATAKLKRENPTASGQQREELLGEYAREYATSKFGDHVQRDWLASFGTRANVIATVEAKYASKLSETVVKGIAIPGLLTGALVTGFNGLNILPQREGVEGLGAESAAKTFQEQNRDYLLSSQFKDWVDIKSDNTETKGLMRQYFTEKNGQTIPSPELWGKDANKVAQTLRADLEADAQRFSQRNQAGGAALPYNTTLTSFFKSPVFKAFVDNGKFAAFVNDGKLSSEFYASPERVAGLQSAVKLDNTRVLFKRIEKGTTLDTSLRNFVGEKVREIETRRATFGLGGQTDSANGITSEFLATNGSKAATVASEYSSMNAANASIIGDVEGMAGAARNTATDFTPATREKLEQLTGQISTLQNKAATLVAAPNQTNEQRKQIYVDQIGLLNQATTIAKQRVGLINAEISRSASSGAAVAPAMTQARQATQDQISTLLSQTQSAQQGLAGLVQTQQNARVQQQQTGYATQVTGLTNQYNATRGQLSNEQGQVRTQLGTQQSLLSNADSDWRRLDEGRKDAIRSESKDLFSTVSAIIGRPVNPQIVKLANGTEAMQLSPDDAKLARAQFVIRKLDGVYPAVEYNKVFNPKTGSAIAVPLRTGVTTMVQIDAAGQKVKSIEGEIARLQGLDNGLSSRIANLDSDYQQKLRSLEQNAPRIAQ
jgi:hypothetical protein